jgi:hypothetical protein
MQLGSMVLLTVGLEQASERNAVISKRAFIKMEIWQVYLQRLKSVSAHE